MTRPGRTGWDVPGIYRHIAEQKQEPAEKLGWNSAEVQRANFDVAFALALEAGVAPSASRVHDAGCGMAHLYDYLQEHGGVQHYVGTDASVEFLKQAAARHPTLTLLQVNLLSGAPASEADITFALGLLAFHHHRSIRQLLNTLWKSTKRVLIFNSWWTLEGFQMSETQDDIRAAVTSFLREKERNDFAISHVVEGSTYGTPSERMFALAR